MAALHSKAVDYVKTGQPAEMPKRLRLNMWPHFMEKKHKRKEQIYHSDKILGLLYDKVESVNFIPLYEEPFDKRILRAYVMEDSMLRIVRQTKSQYDTAMRRIMAQHEIKTEFEVWTTFVLSKPRVGSDYKIQEEMGTISDALKDRFRKVCIDRAGGNDFALLGKFVAGMYKVTKEELDIALAECRRTKLVSGREVPCRKMEPRYMPLISFPWLFEKELGRIATGIEGNKQIEDTLPLSVLNNNSRKRGTGAASNLDDFIQMEDGRTIHRGEELDLFNANAINDDKSNSGDSDVSEARSVHDYRDGHDLVRGTNGEVVINTEFKPKPVPQDLLSGTGVEEVIPRTELDGLVGQVLEPVKRTPSATPTEPNSRQSAVFVQITHSTKQDELTNQVVEPTRHLALSAEKLENRLSSSSYEPMDTPNFSSEDETIEELVEIEIKESALEKLERMMRS